MTNKEAIVYLEGQWDCMCSEDCQIYIGHIDCPQGFICNDGQALQMAISALRAQDLQPTCNNLATDTVSRQAAIAVADYSDYVGLSVEDVKKVTDEVVKGLKRLPSAQTEWNNHTVACLLAELFDDPCACNYNGIDEWLPEKCEVIDACPNPVGVACWEQYLKHRAERRTDG